MASSSSNEKIYLPGFGFVPNKSEISWLLGRKESGCTGVDHESFCCIKEIEFYKHEPMELSNLAIDSGNEKKYFLTYLKKKYPNSEEVINRQTPSGGFWKRTAKDPINIEGEDEESILRKTSFVYYRTSTKKTQWLMKEYTLSNQNELPQWALCVLYYKPGRKSDVNDD